MAEETSIREKLRATPTAGMSGEHSGLYRKYFSSSYKGYVQGGIGGITLYGGIGAAIGAIVGVPLLIATAGTGLGLLPLLLVPGLGMTFGLYGAHAFADIGRGAALMAEATETMEKRNLLWDRYRDLPNTPEFDAEAKEILDILMAEEKPSHVPKQLIHPRPALIGAAIGVTLALVTIAVAPYLGLHFIPQVLGFLGFGTVEGVAATLGASLATAVAGAAIGALGGAVIGLDREHIRHWMDKAEVAVHDPSRVREELALRERDITRLENASQKSRQLLAARSTAEHPGPRAPEPATMGHAPLAALDTQPSPKASVIEHRDRVASAEQVLTSV